MPYLFLRTTAPSVLNANDFLVVTQTASILATGENAISLSGGSVTGTRVRIDGAAYSDVAALAYSNTVAAPGHSISIGKTGVVATTSATISAVSLTNTSANGTALFNDGAISGIGNAITYVGSGARITNAGTVSATGNALVLSGGDAAIDNTGRMDGRLNLTSDSLRLTNTGSVVTVVLDAIVLTAGTSGRLSFVNDGYVGSGANAALSVQRGGGGTFVTNNTGTLQGGNFGILDDSSVAGTSGTWMIQNSGSILARFFRAIQSEAAAFTLTNAATGIVQSQFGNAIEVAGAATIRNAGLIEAANGTAILFGAGTVSVNLTNAGTITGRITAIGGATTGSAVIDNSGTIIGTVGLAASSLTMTNSGRVLGNVVLTTGSDTYLAPGSGSVSGTISGGAGDDTIRGGAEGDDLQGEAGRDSLSGGAGHDTIAGDDGLDRVFGDAGNDSLTGGNDADLIGGGDGDDTLRGDAGADRLSGGAGDDLVLGGNDADTLSGNGGDDRIEGNAGDDLIRGGDGSDTIFADSENDTVSGDAGDDLLAGADGTDRLDGGSGNDILEGGEGADTLLGRAGDDTLAGGGGRDVLTGGSGADVFQFFFATDSATTRALADSITDFRPKVDKVDLSFVMPDTATFSTKGLAGGGVASVAYTKTSGLLRVDANGDKVADFLLLFDNKPGLTAGDFLF